jgi:predicted Zn-dependent protease with MMP-like domain
LPRSMALYGPPVIEVPPDRFEELVADGLDHIPDQLAARMENVVVLVEDHPDEPNLLGRYDGVPLTERGEWYGTGELVLPDRITIFRGPLCAMCTSEQEIVDQVAITVIHEVAHHFGIDDDRLDELGWG